MSGSHPESRTYAAASIPIRSQQRYAAMAGLFGMFVIIGAYLWFLWPLVVGWNRAFIFVGQVLLIVFFVRFVWPRASRSIEESILDMHPTLSLDNEGLHFETIDDPGLAWDDVWKMSITRNPAGEPRSLQLFPSEGPRVCLWDYERMAELESALRTFLGTHISIEDTTREIDWENPMVVAFVNLVLIIMSALVLWLVFQLGKWWLLGIVMEVFMVVAGLLIAFAALSTTRSPSAQRKQRLTGIGATLTALGGLLVQLV